MGLSCFYDVGERVAPSASGTPGAATTCSRDCRGGDCVAGVCKPATLATNQAHPTGLAIDESYVYWTNQAPLGAVMRARKTGAAQPEIVAANQDSPFDIAVDDTNVYFTATGGELPDAGQVLSAPKSGLRQGEAPTVLAAKQTRPAGIAIHDDYVFWTAQGVVRSCHRLVPWTSGENVRDPGVLHAIAADVSYVYWSNTTEQRIMYKGRYEDDGSVGHLLADTGSPPRGVTAAKGLLYWAEEGGRIMKWNTVSLQATVVTKDDAAWDVSADGADVYWTKFTKNEVRSLSSPLPLAPNEDGPYDIASDSDAVYWTDYGAGTVKVLVK